MSITNWIEAGNLDETKRNAAQRHLIRSQPARDQTEPTPGSLFHSIHWLSRIRDQLIVRARLRAYVG